MTSHTDGGINGDYLAPIFGRLKRGPLCNFMVLWCFRCKGYSTHDERPDGWRCIYCFDFTVEFPR